MNIAINGFGRIGRTALRVLHERGLEQHVVAVNDLTDAATLATLLKFDSNYGTLAETIKGSTHESNQKNHHSVGSISVGEHTILVFAEKDPAALPWKELDVDIVIECTGHFIDEKGAKLHLKAGAKRVIISAPAKDGNVKTIVLGVNDADHTAHTVISNASCTTNCIAPVAQIMVDHFTVVKAAMTTIHAYTADQNLQDGPHKDL